MTVKYPDRFNRALPAGFDGLFDWDFLLPAFQGTRITPMDLDAVVERNGQFLVFETKENGAPIPVGQTITLERLVLKGITVIVLRGKTAAEINGFDVWKLRRGEVWKRHIPGTADELVAKVREWFIWASSLEPAA